MQQLGKFFHCEWLIYLNCQIQQPAGLLGLTEESREQNTDSRSCSQRPSEELSPQLACSQCFLCYLVTSPLFHHFECFIKHFQAYISKAWSWPRTSLWLLQSGARFRAQSLGSAGQPRRAGPGVTMPIRTWPSSTVRNPVCHTDRPTAVGPLSPLLRGLLRLPKSSLQTAGCLWALGTLFPPSCSVGPAVHRHQSSSLQENQYCFQLCASN